VAVFPLCETENSKAADRRGMTPAA